MQPFLGKLGRTEKSSRDVKGGDDQVIQGMADLELAKQQQEQSGDPGSRRHRHHRRSQTQQIELKDKSKAGIPHTHKSSRAYHPSGAATTAGFPAKGHFPEDVEYDVVGLGKFYTKYRSTLCYKCQAPLGAKVSITRLLKQWSCGKSSTGSVNSVCSTACSACSTLTCLGCGKKPRIGVNVKNTEHGVLDWCCGEGRLLAIWLFVARYDEIHLQMEVMVARNSRLSKSGLPGRDSRVTAKGVGYAEDDLSWDQNPWEPIYDNSFGLRSGITAMEAIGFKQADAMTDKVLGQISLFVCALLPDPAETSTFDRDPPRTLCAFFQLGLLLDKLAELLRNDSINDLSARASLYFAVLELVRKLTSHPGTSSLVIAERHSKKYTKGLQLIAGAEELTSWDKFSPVAGAGQEPLSISGTCSSLASLIKGLVKQSIVILSAPHEFRGRSGQRTLDLCTEVSMLNATIMSIAPGGEGKGKGKATTDTRTGYGAAGDKWIVWHKEHGLEQTDEVLGISFYYLKELDRLRRSPKGRVPRLIKEIAEMSTGLPPGILVRVSPERPDAMKCLIIGPDDTPYAGGLFEFDIFATENYPNEPPKFHFLTTGGGAACMNPNLYSNGHVCLSLLGTWEGPPESKWQSQKSTMLQVLLSIQSMILVSDPWRNEPLNQSDSSKTSTLNARNYSEERQVYTVLYAMIPWLEQRGGGGGGDVWRDAVDVYFRCHAERIVKMVRGWTGRNERLRRYWRGPYTGNRTIDVVARLEEILTARSYISAT